MSELEKGTEFILDEREVTKQYNYLVKNALNTCKQFDLFDCLGINSMTEQSLFCLYIAIRLVRTQIYSGSYLLSHPYSIIMSKIPGLRGVVADIDKSDRTAREVEKSMLNKEKEIKESLQSDAEKMRVRALELAANDLIARSTQESPTSMNMNIVISSTGVLEWYSKWRKELRSISA